ncbi:16S rRNA (guanine966-N2)-methyltransferase [Micrococcales bacterium KH10]|nr:16S rRNA (guanine966-N2)-methyltransferase [Micrococcales bacterium KH10]
MSRIIAGRLGGRTIAVPPKGTRPTSDRIREAVFAKLEHWGALKDAVVLDLFAGSGALGFEAISRGATRAVFVESARQAAQIVRSNGAELGLTDQIQVVMARAEKFVTATGAGPWDLIFLDPPYELTAASLDALMAALEPRTAPGAVIVVERDRHAPTPTWPDSWELIESKDYGSTMVHYAERHFDQELAAA